MATTIFVSSFTIRMLKVKQRSLDLVYVLMISLLTDMLPLHVNLPRAAARMTAGVAVSCLKLLTFSSTLSFATENTLIGITRL